MRHTKTVCRLMVSAFVAVATLVACAAAKTYSTQEINQLLSKLQQEIKDKGYHYTVGPTSVIGYSVEELCGLDFQKEQLNLAPREPSSLEKTLSLPASFDWNAQGKCTPVKNQGNCLSCWAFASIGSYESALEISNSVTTDLSEEYLVFCSPQGYGCNVGGSCAFLSMAAGTPLESCSPYLGTAPGCQCPKYYPIQASYSVDTSAASIKQAIYSHGGVYSTVAATNAFMAYTGGIFDNNDPSAPTNHAIVLVGWDDTKKAWRLRNSWGTGWGEAGYMWIGYGCLRVGLGTQYAVPAGTNSQLAAPSNLTATTVSVSQINLAWKNNASSVSGFYVECKAGSGAYAQIAAVGPTVVSYANTGLVSNTVYTYRVRAYTAKLTSDYSNEASAMTTTLAAPSNQTAAMASVTQINLSWKNNAGTVSGFYIERRTGSAAYAQIAAVGANVLTYANTGLTSNTMYTYRVRAYTTQLYSDYSNEASATTTNVPAPTNLTVQAATASLVNLKWQESSSSITGFYIESKIGSGAYGQIAIEPSTVLTVAVALLTPGTTYTFRVRAYSNLLTSAFSNEVSFTTISIAAPTGLTATKASSTQINLGWKNNAAAGSLAGFYIERKTGSAAYAPIASVGPTTTTYANGGLTSNTAYTYRVRAYNAYLYSDYSNEAGATTTNLPAPTSLTVQAVTASLVNLKWQESPASISGFYIESKIGSGAYGQIAAVSSAVLTVAVALLTPNTTYTFRVRAYSSALTSDYSPEVSYTTIKVTAPSNLIATKALTTQINLAWKNNAAAGSIAGFYIERKAGTGAYAPIASVGPTATTFSNIGLTTKTTYSYRVRAYNAYLYSDYSNEAAATLGNTVGAAILFTSNPSAPRSVSIIDAHGACILQTLITGQFSVSSLTFSQHLAPGFYVARIKDGAEISLQRFVVGGERVAISKAQ